MDLEAFFWYFSMRKKVTKGSVAFAILAVNCSYGLGRVIQFSIHFDLLLEVSSL